MKKNKMKKNLLIFSLLSITINYAQTLNPTVSINSAGSADAFKGGYTFAYATSGTPWNGSLISFGGFANQYDTQFSANYASSKISFRTRNGDFNNGVGKWNDWQELATKGSNEFIGNQIINGKLLLGQNLSQDKEKFYLKGGHNSTTFMMHADNGGSAHAYLSLWASEPQLTYDGVGIGNNIRTNLVNNIALTRVDESRGASYIRLLSSEINFNILPVSGEGKKHFLINSKGVLTNGEIRANEGNLLSVRSNDEGGALDLVNVLKTGSLAKQWTIYNMSGHYGNGLQFWNYAADGSKSGVKLKISDEGDMALYGKLEAKEIKVTTSPTADFVFEESYNLPSLESVEQYIKEKKHLPEIASAKEMEKDGVNVGEFQIKLLQKIEELTLYTIEQNKQLNDQNAEIQRLKLEIQLLKK